jgi:hypothetical protein
LFFFFQIVGPDGRALIQVDGPHCLLEGTVVVKANGERCPVESLHQGDQLFGTDGATVTVTNQIKRGARSAVMYEITDADGRSYTVTPGHQVVTVFTQRSGTFKTRVARGAPHWHEMSVMWWDRASITEREMRFRYSLPGEMTPSESHLFTASGEYGIAAPQIARTQEQMRAHAAAWFAATIPWESRVDAGELIEITAEQLFKRWKEFHPSTSSVRPLRAALVALPPPPPFACGALEQVHPNQIAHQDSNVSKDKHSTVMSAPLRKPKKLQAIGGYPYVSVEVDGDHRFALANGTLTHNSAPTQHIGEYSTVMVVGAGIGATPVSSTLKSIVFHKWRVNVGECFPQHAYFVWVCAHRDIDAFRWLIRTIKEAQDEIVHMRANNAAQMASKTCQHTFAHASPLPRTHAQT